MGTERPVGNVCLLRGVKGGRPLRAKAGQGNRIARLVARSRAECGFQPFSGPPGFAASRYNSDSSCYLAL